MTDGVTFAFGIAGVHGPQRGPGAVGGVADVNGIVLFLLQRKLMLTDGCYGASNTTDCSLVVNGLFSKGLHAVIQYFCGTLRDVLNVRATMDTSVVLLPQRIADTRWKDAELIAFYLNEGLATANALRQASIEYTGNSYLNIMNVAEVR